MKESKEGYAFQAFDEATLIRFGKLLIFFCNSRLFISCYAVFVLLTLMAVVFKSQDITWLK